MRAIEEDVDAASLLATPEVERASKLRDAIETARGTMAQNLAAGQGGLAASGGLSDAYDGVVRALWDAALSQVDGAADMPLALVATGGWGRREMCPYSDIDFAVVPGSKLRSRHRDRVKEIADSLLYPLWDAKLSVGHAIRTAKEAARLAKEDLATATSLLDARLLAGDESVFDELRRQTTRALGRASMTNDFVAQLATEQRRRHDRFGASLYLLEPNLKQGIGALRDLATGLWAARARWELGSLDDIVSRGQISAREATLLTSALDFLLEARSRVHLHVGRLSDQLTFEIQEAIGPELYPDVQPPEGDIRPAVAPAVEELMRRYYLHARNVVQVTERLLEYAVVPPRKKPRIMKLDRTFVVFNGKLSVSDPAVFRERPSEMVRLFKVALDQGLPIYAHTRELVARAMTDQPEVLTGDPEANRLFLELLVDPRDKGQPSLLEQMHALGVLNALMPEFAPCTCRVQHDLYHVYTVDQHQLYAVALLKKIARGAMADSAETVTEATRSVARPESLYLGTLLHDVGKPLGKGHAEKGAQLTRTIGERLGLAPADRERAELLVRQHLTMSTLSQRRDLNDAAMIERFSDRVGDEETLAQLYVLTYCDTAMTAPGNLTDWKDSLLRQLYRKSRAHLRGETEAPESAEEARARTVRTQIRQQCEDAGEIEEDDVDRFFEGLDDRYFAALQPRQIMQHLEMSREFAEKERPLVRITRRPRRDNSEVAVVTRDRHGALTAVAGVLAANRLDVLGAYANSRDSQGPTRPALAFNQFFVTSGAGEAVEANDPLWDQVRADLAELVDRPAIDLDAVREVFESRRTKSFLGPRVTPDVPTTIAFDNAVSDRFTVIDVVTEDRVGVLYTITDALTRLGLDIDLSKVTSEGNRAIDSFYVTHGGTTQKVEDPDTLAQIEERLREALAGLEYETR